MSIFEAKSIPEDYTDHATCSSPPPPPGYRIINADGGVYWRAASDWTTAIRRPGYGVYTGDRVSLDCWTRGGIAPPFNNDNLWYHATILSGTGRGAGYVNDQFVYTGTYQPVSGVPQCGGRPPAPPTPSASASNNGGEMAVQLSNFPLGITYFFCHVGDGSGYPTGGSISNHGQINVTSPNESFSSGLCSGTGNFWIGFQATDGHDYYSNQVMLIPPPPPAGCTAAPTISSYALSYSSGPLLFTVSFRAYNGSWTFAATDLSTGQIVRGTSFGAPADETTQHGGFNHAPLPGITYDSTIVVTTACGSATTTATLTVPAPAGSPPTITSIPDITIGPNDAGSHPVTVNYVDDDCDVVGGTWLDANNASHGFGVGAGDALHPSACASGAGYTTPGYSSCTSPDGVRGTPGSYAQTITLQDSLGRVSLPYTFYVICAPPAPPPPPDVQPVPTLGPVLPLTDPGQIAYDALNGYVTLVHPDGTGMTEIGPIFAHDPQWSPDATKILYLSNGTVQGLGISVMNADGTSPQLLIPDATDNSWYDAAARWSPDGSKIVFIRWGPNFPSEVYVANADGSGVTAVPNTSNVAGSVSWSPDGSFILFDQNGGTIGGPHLYVIRPNGTERRQITNGRGESRASWSPDGRTIVYICADANGQPNHAICSIGATQPETVLLQDGTRTVDYPSWSPDSRQVLFEIQDPLPPGTPPTPPGPGTGPKMALMPASGGAYTVIAQPAFPGSW